MKVFAPFIVFLISLFIVSPILAATSVNVSANGSGADSHVEIHNSVNATSNSTVTSNQDCQTTITVNGKTYTSDNCGDMNVQSDNGHASVQINHSGSSVSTGSTAVTNAPTPDITKIQQDTNDKVKAEQEKAQKQIEEQQKKLEDQTSFLQKFFEDQLNQLKSLFSHLF